MIVVDQTGRKLKVGQLVDVMMIGMFKAQVVAIKDSPIVLAPGQTIHPHLVISMVVTPAITPNGNVPDVYIVAEPDPKKIKEVEAMEKSRFEM